MCKEYGHLLGDDPAWAVRAKLFSEKVRDVHELLVPPVGRGESDRSGGGERGGLSDGAPAPIPLVAVAYDAPCHLHHGQRVVTPPMALLSTIPGISLVPLTDSEQCCGSAGIFSLVRPDVAEKVLAPKLARIGESGAAIIATGNPGCLMQIGGGLIRDGGAVVTRHPVELLDAHYARESSRD
jgi:glycolate oxidase iron-sulfur subunit